MDYNELITFRLSLVSVLKAHRSDAPFECDSGMFSPSLRITRYTRNFSNLSIWREILGRNLQRDAKPSRGVPAPFLNDDVGLPHQAVGVDDVFA